MRMVGSSGSETPGGAPMPLCGTWMGTLNKTNVLNRWPCSQPHPRPLALSFAHARGFATQVPSAAKTVPGASRICCKDVQTFALSMPGSGAFL